MNYVTAKDFAISEGLPLNMVKRLCRNGTLPHLRYGRSYSIPLTMAREALIAFMEMQSSALRSAAAAEVVVVEEVPVVQRQAREAKASSEFAQILKTMAREAKE